MTTFTPQNEFILSPIKMTKIHAALFFLLASSIGTPVFLSAANTSSPQSTTHKNTIPTIVESNKKTKIYTPSWFWHAFGYIVLSIFGVLMLFPYGALIDYLGGIGYGDKGKWLGSILLTVITLIVYSVATYFYTRSKPNYSMWKYTIGHFLLSIEGLLAFFIIIWASPGTSVGLLESGLVTVISIAFLTGIAYIYVHYFAMEAKLKKKKQGSVMA